MTTLHQRKLSGLVQSTEEATFTRRHPGNPRPGKEEANDRRRFESAADKGPTSGRTLINLINIYYYFFK